MSARAIRAARIAGASRARWVAIEGTKIADVGSGRGPRDALDIGRAILAPGFIDIQVNGVGDADFNEPDADGWSRGARMLLAHGVTSFCPTVISQPLESYEAPLDVAEDARAADPSDPPRAEIVGVHLEGPFLGGAPGAHDPDVLRRADPGWMTKILAAHPGLVRVVTLAPEADPGLELTRLLTEAGVLVSLGHSTATLEEAIAATDAGARAVTHLFNGMSPFHHRDPGLVGAALDDERLTPSLIADLVHVNPVALRLACSRKANVALVSDAIAAQGSWASARGIRVIDSAPRLPDGTLAGSVLTMDQAVHNMTSVGIPLERSIEMASKVPARLLGLDDRGAIATDARADLVALDPDDLTVLCVWKAGELVYEID